MLGFNVNRVLLVSANEQNRSERIKPLLPLFSFVDYTLFLPQMLFLAPLLLASTAAASGARNYAILDTYIGSSFLSGWVHQNISDPTHGRVK